MKTISLSRSKETIVDDDDYEYLSQWSWLAISVGGGKWYAGRYEHGAIVLMHRVIAGTPNNKETDHRNRDGLDNRRENLRVCSHQQNQQNRLGWIRCDSKRPSLFKGVYFEPGYGRSVPRAKPWCSQIVVGGKKIRRYHYNEEDAARTYDQMAEQFFGEFAVLNFTQVAPV